MSSPKDIKLRKLDEERRGMMGGGDDLRHLTSATRNPKTLQYEQGN